MKPEMDLRAFQENTSLTSKKDPSWIYFRLSLALKAFTHLSLLGLDLLRGLCSLME